MKYAVIVADLNGLEIGEVISTHRTEAGAYKAQPDVPGAYVARKTQDGEWESRIEARDRRENNSKIGRPALPDSERAKTRAIRLSDADYAELQRRGMTALREWLRRSA